MDADIGSPEEMGRVGREAGRAMHEIFRNLIARQLSQCNETDAKADLRKRRRKLQRMLKQYG